MKFAAGILLAVTAATGGEWSFDGLEPLTSDDGRQSLTGSAAVRRGEGIVGNALYFDGRDDFLELQLTGESRPRDEMTVSFWVRPEADSEFFQLVRSPARDLCFDGGPGFGWYEVHTASGRQIYNGYAHPQRLQPEQWYHFALVYDQNALELYLDGDLISRTAAEQPGELRFSGEPWRIGGRLREDGGFFHGWLDDLKVLPAADRDFGEVKRLKRRERLKALGSESLDAYRRERMAALFGAGAAGLPYAVAVESGLTRILPAAFHPGNFQPEVAVESAAFERENCQLLILPYEGRRLTGFSVELPATLTDAAGCEHPFDFKASRVSYDPMPKPSPYMYPLPRIPDRLLELEPFEAGGDEPAVLWLEIFTPGRTPAGEYRGTIVLRQPDSPAFELPVRVKVWNFELPERNIVPSLVNVWERDLQSYVEEGDAEGFVALLDQYCSMLLEHRLNPVVLAHAGLVAPWLRRAVYPDYRVENGRAVGNMGYFDELIAKYRRRGLSVVAVGPHYNFDETKLDGGDWWMNIQATEPAKIWSFIRRHAAERGYLADAVAYPIDEPEKDVELVNRVENMLAAAAPDLPMLLTSGGANYPDPAMPGVDIWVPILHWTNRPEQLKARRAGKPVWTYVCTGPNYPLPNLHSDTPPCGIRMLAVGAARFDYDGLLHWAANFNTYKNAPAEPNPFAAGEGTYIYAAADGRPIPTIRLKSLADGMEDWTYLELLREKNPAVYAEIRAELARLIPEREYDRAKEIRLQNPREASFHTFLDPEAFYAVYDDPAAWLAIRHKIGEALSAVQ